MTRRTASTSSPKVRGTRRYASGRGSRSRYRRNRRRGGRAPRASGPRLRKPVIACILLGAVLFLSQNHDLHLRLRPLPRQRGRDVEPEGVWKARVACGYQRWDCGSARCLQLPVVPPFLETVSGRSHSETCTGCIVSRATPTSSAFNASRSVSSRSLAAKTSRVLAASYFLR